MRKTIFVENNHGEFLKKMVLVIAAVIAISFMLASCDKDKTDTGGGDLDLGTVPLQETDDDVSDACTTALTEVFDCGFVLTDDEGNDLTLNDAVLACENGEIAAACAADCGINFSVCADIESCLTSDCG